jgi:hypothetical protein
MLRIQAWMVRREAEEKTVDGCYDVEKWRLFALNLF